MSLNYRNRYGNRVNESSIDYPSGSFKNKSAPDAVDGTPLERDWANDFLGTRDAILKEAGISANGNIDTAQSSQVLQALKQIFVLPTLQASQTVLGLSRVATQAEVLAGTNSDKYVTPASLNGKSASGDEVIAGTAQNKLVTPAGLAAKSADNSETQAGTIFNKFVTPQGLSSRTATETRSGLTISATIGEVNAGSNDGKFVSPPKLKNGFQFGGDVNGHLKLPSWLGGFIIQWGRVPAGNLGNDGANFSIPFPNACFSVIPTIFGTTSDPVQSLTMHVTNITNTGVAVSKKYAGTQAGGSANFGSSSQGWTYIAIGW